MHTSGRANVYVEVTFCIGYSERMYGSRGSKATLMLHFPYKKATQSLG